MHLFGRSLSAVEVMVIFRDGTKKKKQKKTSAGGLVREVFLLVLLASEQGIDC